MKNSEAITIIVNLFEIHFRGPPKEHRLVQKALNTLNELVIKTDQKEAIQAKIELEKKEVLAKHPKK